MRVVLIEPQNFFMKCSRRKCAHGSMCSCQKMRGWWGPQLQIVGKGTDGRCSRGSSRTGAGKTPGAGCLQVHCSVMGWLSSSCFAFLCLLQVCALSGEPLTSISFHPLLVVDKGDIPWLPFFTQSNHQLLLGFPSGFHHFSSCLVPLHPDDLSSVCYGTRALGQRTDSMDDRTPERSIFNSGLLSL